MGGGLHSTSDESESALLEIERGGRRAALTRATGFCGWFFSHDGVFFIECEDFLSESFFRLFRLLSVHSSDSLLADITFDFFGGRPLRFSLIFTGLGGSSYSVSDEIKGFDLIFNGDGLGIFVEPFFRPLFFGSSTGSSFFTNTGVDFLSANLAGFTNDFLRFFFSHFANAEYFLCKSVTGLDDACIRLLYDESLSQLLSRVFFFLSSSSSDDEEDEDEEEEESDWLFGLSLWLESESDISDNSSITSDRCVGKLGLDLGSAISTGSSYENKYILFIIVISNLN